MSDAKLTQFPPGKDQIATGYPPNSQVPVTGSRPPWTHSRLTRDAYSYFELDIPPIGITNQGRIWGNLTLALVVFSLILVPLAIAGIIGGILTNSIIVLILVAVICPLVWICSAFFIIVLFRIWFRHQTLIITPEEYQFIERFVRFTPVLRALRRPSGQSIIGDERSETNGKECRGSRQRFLKAKTGILDVCHGTPYGFIELDFNFLGYGLTMDELEWLTGEINDFLQVRS